MSVGEVGGWFSYRESRYRHIPQFSHGVKWQITASQTSQKDFPLGFLTTSPSPFAEHPSRKVHTHTHWTTQQATHNSHNNQHTYVHTNAPHPSHTHAAHVPKELRLKIQPNCSQLTWANLRPKVPNPQAILSLTMGFRSYLESVSSFKLV